MKRNVNTLIMIILTGTKIMAPHTFTNVWKHLIWILGSSEGAQLKIKGLQNGLKHNRFYFSFFGSQKQQKKKKTALQKLNL